MNVKINENGFTLIELLIVVAIIGVLAGIAIPQFNKYRVNGFNASAISDLRNLKTTQESLFTEYHRYGGTAVGALPGPGLAAGVTVFSTGGAIISTTDVTNVIRGIAIPVGSNVTVCATAEPVFFSSFNAVAKHQRGDAAFGVDTDSSSLFRHIDFPTIATAISYSIIPADVPVPVIGAIEFTQALGWSPL